jgi:hypothetical protein
MERQQTLKNGTLDQWGDAWITAALCYLRFECAPREIAAPILLVRWRGTSRLTRRLAPGLAFRP